jgi:hypothetical protein
LHLAEENSETAQELIDNGASLLAQNMALQAAGSRHSELVSEWLQSKALNLEDTVVAVCKAKNLPTDIALYITEFYVSLHLADHFERAFKQETSDRHWPWMGLALTYHLYPKGDEDNNGETNEVATAWSLHKEVIKRSLFANRSYRSYWSEEDDEVAVEDAVNDAVDDVAEDAENDAVEEVADDVAEDPVEPAVEDNVDHGLNAAREFVRVELTKVKFAAASELFTQLRSEIFELGLFDDSPSENGDGMDCDNEEGSGADEEEVEEEDDDQEADEDEHVSKKPKKA